MDLQGNLIESRKKKQKGLGKASLFSLVMHSALLATFIFLGATTTHKVDAEDKIKMFITQGAAPPPPPPPPPPAASSSAPKSTPKVQPRPTPVVQPSFVAPVEIPKEIPKVEAPITTAEVDLTPSEAAPSEPEGGVVGGVPGGVPGGVVGGVQGGVVGGTVGGEIGGVIGGQVGGTGTGTEGEGSGGKEAPVAIPEGPVRVGGDVKAPKVTDRTEPEYTATARQARVAGVVIVEAIIDRNGNVDQVKVIKGLPMGLSEAAERAVKKWKFRPGTLNGQPVDVIFNLTVNFKLG